LSYTAHLPLLPNILLLLPSFLLSCSSFSSIISSHLLHWPAQWCVKLKSASRRIFNQEYN
jgi:hypothetical protein